MTGFGTAHRDWEGPDGQSGSRRVSVEVRSVNGRFLELKVRQPFGVAVDAAVRKRVERRVRRGRVDLWVHVMAPEGSGLASLGIDAGQLRQLAEAAVDARRIAVEAGLEVRQPNVLELMRFLVGDKHRNDSSLGPPTFLPDLVDDALEGLCAMRDTEGESLERTLAGLFDELAEHVEIVRETLAPEAARIEARVLERMESCAIKAGLEGADRDRVAHEVAALLTRGDVTEEFDRIRSHLGQVRTVLGEALHAGQGKKLDFLVQELLRETTTIGSKITAHRGSAAVIAAKGTIERIREQVQNVE